MDISVSAGKDRLAAKLVVDKVVQAKAARAAEKCKDGAATKAIDPRTIATLAGKLAVKDCCGNGKCLARFMAKHQRQRCPARVQTTLMGEVYAQC
jgi:hypothetical protein